MSALKKTPLKKDDVTVRLSFAERRLSDLLNLNGGNLAGGDALYRLQLLQEFFFHLTGATEVLAQFINEARKLGIDSEYVSPDKIARQLPQGDQLRAEVRSLYKNPRKKSIPPDPYSDEGYLYRVYNYRHQVTHRHRNPLHFQLPPPVGVKGSAGVSLWIDPRDPNVGPSSKQAQDELSYMFNLIKEHCERILSLI